jgi:major membrane immunogen (membrane-anchored lipoprotein)
MKNFKKVVVTTLVALFMVFNLTAVAGAATTYTDGIYDTESTPDANGSMYKMHIEVVDGEIDFSTFEWWNGSNKMTSQVIDYVADDAKAGIQAALDEVKNYSDQLYETKDGAAVVAASAESTMYPGFQECWTKFVEQATGATKDVGLEATDNSATDTAAETATTTTDVPKTGVFGLGVVYGLGAFATGAFVLKKKAK